MLWEEKHFHRSTRALRQGAAPSRPKISNEARTLAKHRQSHEPPNTENQDLPRMGRSGRPKLTQDCSTPVGQGNNPAGFDQPRHRSASPKELSTEVENNVVSNSLLPAARIKIRKAGSAAHGSVQMHCYGNNDAKARDRNVSAFTQEPENLPHNCSSLTFERVGVTAPITF